MEDYTFYFQDCSDKSVSILYAWIWNEDDSSSMPQVHWINEIIIIIIRSLPLSQFQWSYCIPHMH